MNDAEQRTIDLAVALHKERKYADATHLYNCVLNRHPFNEGLMSLLADAYIRQEMTGLAVNLLTNALERNPKNSKAWNDLGIAFRKENRYEQAQKAYERSIEIAGDTVEACANMAGLYGDRAQPEQAIHWCDRVLAIEPGHTDAIWHKALALLTQRKWPEGWDCYESRQQLDSWDSRKSITAPLWDFGQTDHLYIHGEQGIGDEVMFLSCLDEILPRARHVTVEVHPAVAGIVRTTWPTVSVVTQETTGDYSAKIPLGSLCARLRRADDAFPGTSYLKPDESLVEHYRARLTAIGPRPWIAVTWLGGVKATRVEERSLNLSELRPILDRYTCVSAQYEHVLPVIAKEREKEGLVCLDNLCVGKDIAHQAALFKAVDAVVTVQQTAVHVAGAVGAKTFAMIGAAPHWRYGLEGNLPWYESVELYRKCTDWADVINRVDKDIANFFRVSRAKSATAQRAA